MAKTATKDMTVGNPIKILILFAIPVLIGNVFQQLYNMVDTIIVGQNLGKDALAAVGSTGSLNFLVNGFSFGITGGFAVLPAQFFGARNEKMLKRSVAQAISLCVIFTIILTLVSVTCTRPVLELMNTPEEIINDAEVYIKTIFAGICVTIFYNMCACLLRALGDSQTPLYFLILSSFLNIGMDLLFIINFKWGVFGAAFATILAQAIAGIACVIYAYKRYNELHVSWEDFRPDYQMIGKHLAIGLPMAFQFSITAIGTVVLQGALNSFGPDNIAAFTAGGKVEQLVTQIGPAIGVTMANYAGQNLGAGRLDRIKSGVRSCTVFTIILSVLAALAVHFASPALSGLFISDGPGKEAVVAASVQYIDTVCVFFPALFMIFVYRNVLQGIGRSFMPLMAGFFELIARCSVAFTLPKTMGFVGICLAGPVAWLAACIPLGISYYVIFGKLLKNHSTQLA